MTEPTPDTDEPQVVSTRLALLVMALVVALVVAWVAWLGQASRAPLVGAWSEDRDARHAPHWYDSSEGDLLHHHEGQGPALAGDGRVAGELPFAWSPRTYTARVSPGLGMSWPTPRPLSGARVVLTARPTEPVTLSLEIGAERREVTLTEQDALVTLDAPTAALFIQLTLPKEWPETLGVAELEPLHPGERVWLVAPPNDGDLEAELLRAYGARATQRASFATPVAEVLRRASTLVLTDAPLPKPWHAPVHAWVRAGGLLIELGPTAGGCPELSAAAPQPLASPAQLEGASLAGPARWTGPLAAPGDPGAQPAEELVRTTGDDAQAVLARYTRGEGACLRWWGDVATELRRQRQGLEERANKDVDGKGGFQPRDLLADTLTRADHNAPSADLLGFALAAAASERVGVMAAPLPEATTVVVLTADQDFVPEAALMAQSNALPPEAALTAMLTAGAIGAAPDVKYDGSPENLITRDLALELGDLGHDVGIHPNLWKLDGGPERFGEVVQRHADGFEEEFRTRPLLVRNHHLVWSGYVEMARHHARAGLEMNFDYMSLAFAPDGDLGYMAGGAIPVRFADAKGRVVPLLQQATQLDDHVMLPARFGYHAYDAESLEARSREVLALAIRYRTPLVVNHHPFWWSEDKGRWQRALVTMAAEAKAPVWSAGRWLRFTRGQRDVRVWCAAPESCAVWSTTPNTPLLVSEEFASIALNGRPVVDDGARRVIGGRPWKSVTLTTPGAHRVELKR